MPRRRPPRIALPVVVLAFAMIGLAVWTAVQALTADGDGQDAAPLPELTRVGSRPRPATEAAALTIGVGPSAYTITYDVREPGRPVAREVISVIRPFASRRTTSVDETVTAFARLSSTPKGGATTVVSPPPSAVDPRPDLVVPRAVDEGLMTRREARVVRGTPCQVYRSLGGITASTISAALPGRFTDVCISEDGLILEEWQHDEGRAVRQRVAVDVERSAEVPPITDAPTLTAAQGGGSVLAVDPASRPEGRFFELDQTPSGFTRRGRYSVVPPQPGLTDPEQRRKAIASTADVYERDTDVVIVDRGSTLNLERAFQPRPEGRPIADLGPAFGGAEGELLLGWSGPEIRWGDEDGRFVRVIGTVDVDTLVGIVRSIRATDGGTGLVFTGAPL